MSFQYYLQLFCVKERITLDNKKDKTPTQLLNALNAKCFTFAFMHLAYAEIYEFYPK